MTRNYNGWNSYRTGTNNRLNNIPHVVNYLNDSNKRYYSSIDAEIFIGDYFIDEVTSITWSVQQQTMPLYGYNSYTFDDIAIGSRVVQGQFSINFVKANFLEEVLQTITSISRRLYGNDQNNSSSFSDEFRQRLSTPVWDKGFDIVVGFGDQNNSINSLNKTTYQTYVVLDCCQITGSSISLDYNGNPIEEVYTFIARDMKHHVATEAEKNASIATNTDTTNSIEGSSKLSLQSYLDLSGNTGKLTITSKQSASLRTGDFHIITSLDCNLNDIRELQTTDGLSLYYVFSLDETKKLKNELKKKNMQQINIGVSIEWFNQNSNSTYSNTQKDNLTLIANISY